MKKLILATAAAFVLTSGYANAALLLSKDENDRKVVVNTWAGQSEDKRSERYGSSASTFSGVVAYSNEKNTHDVFVGRFQGKPRGESVSTFSGRRSAGDSIRGMYKNTHEVWIRR